jgi:hypothetical protein
MLGADCSKRRYSTSVIPGAGGDHSGPKDGEVSKVFAPPTCRRFHTSTATTQQASSSG